MFGVFRLFYPVLILSLLLSSLPAFSKSKLEILPESMPAMLLFPPSGHTHGIRKATQAKLKMLLGPAASFNDPQGIVAIRMKSRDNLKTRDDDAELTVYGVNSGNCELIYNTSKRGLASFGKKGSGKNEFDRPMGIAADEAGRVYVADSRNNRIVKLFNPKKTVHWISSFGISGSSPGQFKEPEGVAVDSRGRIYVADTKNNRVQILDSTGQPQGILGGPSDTLFSLPTQLAVADTQDPRTRNPENSLYVIDQNGLRIQKLSFDGTLLAQVQARPGQFLGYLCLDYYQQVYVTDRANGCVLKFDRHLSHLGSFGTTGSGDREFLEPRGITIWRNNGQLFIAERDGAQYYWTGTDGHDIQLKASSPGRFELSLFTEEFSLLSLWYTIRGDTIRPYTGKTVPSGTVSLTFDEKETLPDSFTLRLEPARFSRTFFAKQWACRFK